MTFKRGECDLTLSLYKSINLHLIHIELQPNDVQVSHNCDHRGC